MKILSSIGSRIKGGRETTDHSATSRSYLHQIWTFMCYFHWDVVHIVHLTMTVSWSSTYLSFICKFSLCHYQFTCLVPSSIISIYLFNLIGTHNHLCCPCYLLSSEFVHNNNIKISMLFYYTTDFITSLTLLAHFNSHRLNQLLFFDAQSCYPCI